MGNKAYRTQGGEDALFREIARVLHEYGHVYSRPPSMPQNRAGLIIATYEGVKVDWPVLIADGLCAAIESVRGKEGRKIGTAVAQWVTLLEPPIEPVKTTKRGRTMEGTPKTASKRQQLLVSKAPKGKAADTDKASIERANRKRQAGTQEETPARLITVILRRPIQQEPDPLAMKINIKTQEEEVEEDPIEHLQTGRGAFGTKEGCDTDRVEPEPVRAESVTEVPAQQAIPAGQDTTRPVIQEPVIQLPPSPACCREENRPQAQSVHKSAWTDSSRMHVLCCI